MGNAIWARQAGGIGEDYSLRAALDATGNIFITGSFSRTARFGTTTLMSAGMHDIFIAKYDAAGNVLWARSAGGLREDFGRAAAIDYSGAVYFTGDFEVNATFGDTALTSVAASRDICIARYDQNGTFLWARRVGGPESDEAGAITAGQFGNCKVTGQFRGTATFGETTLTSQGESDIFVLMAGSLGDLYNVKQIGGPSVDVPNRIWEDNAGNSFVVGKFNHSISLDGTTLNSHGGLDLFLAKYDQAGYLQWAKSAGPVELDAPIGLALDKAGNVWVSGSLVGDATFDNFKVKNIYAIDAFIAQYDAHGGVVTAEPAGGRGYEYCYGLAIGKDGNPIITGEFEGQAIFGRFLFSSFGRFDVFLAKRASPPDPFVKVTTGVIPTDGGDDGLLSQGCSWVDYDNDDDLDLFIAAAGDEVLYRNDGNGAFTKLIFDPTLIYDGSSHAATWGDYDNDGDLDLIVANSYNAYNFLYANNGDGTFTGITAGAMVNEPNDSRGSSWIDFDLDGDLDLFVSNWGRNNFLYQNNGGLFGKVSSGIVVSEGGRSNGVSAGDYDGDGKIDLLMGNWNQNNFLYRGNVRGRHWIKIKCIGAISNRSAIGAKIRVHAVINGEPLAQFHQISAQTGYGGQNSLTPEFGLGDAARIDSIIITWPSRLVQVLTNVPADQAITVTEGEDRLLLANFRADVTFGSAPFQMRFTDHSTTAFPPITSWEWDFNNDGIVDSRVQNPTWVYENGGVYSVKLTVSNVLGSETLLRENYINVSFPEQFTQVTNGAIVTDAGNSLAGSWGDFDNDGDLDLFVTNKDRNNSLFLGNGKGVFAKLTSSPIATEGGSSQVGSWGDYDNDGDVDLFIANAGGNNLLFRNNGNNNHWISFNLKGTFSNSTGHGVEVRLKANIDETPVWQTRALAGETKYGQNDLRPHFGLGNAAQADSVIIAWPSGIVQSLANVAADQILTITETGTIPLAANFTADTLSGAIPFTVQFSDLSRPQDGTISSWTWDFDNDGRADSDQQNPAWTYATPGYYSVKLTVSDGVSSRTLSRQNYIRVVPPDPFTKVLTGPVVSDRASTTGNAWGDYDNDGDVDLFLAHRTNGVNNFLYRNDGSGTFMKVTLGDISLDGAICNSATWGDYDNDGDLDLFVANYQNDPDFLYANQGEGSLIRVFAGDLSSENRNSFGCSWGDYDNDGYLDLFVQDDLFKNTGTGTFAKDSRRPISLDDDHPRSGSWADYDNDGDLDLFVTNLLRRNSLYRNSGDGAFTKITDDPVAMHEGQHMGSSWGDYDNDGDLDLFVANVGNNALFANNGDGTFTEITEGAIVNDGGISHGSSWGDFDNDGDLVQVQSQTSLLLALKFE